MYSGRQVFHCGIGLPKRRHEMPENGALATHGAWAPHSSPGRPQKPPRAPSGLPSPNVLWKAGFLLWNRPPTAAPHNVGKPRVNPRAPQAAKSTPRNLPRLPPLGPPSQNVLWKAGSLDGAPMADAIHTGSEDGSLPLFIAGSPRGAHKHTRT